MRKDFRPTYKSNQWKKYLLLFFAIVILVAVVFIGRNIFNRVFITAGSPFWKIRTEILEDSRFAVGMLKPKKTLVQENILLTDEVRKSKSLASYNRLLREENAKLKNYWNRKIFSNEHILATILVRPPVSPFDSLIVDAGSLDGVSVGDLVVAYPRVAIGKVVWVDGNTAKILLFSSPDEVTGVLVGTSTIATVAIGRGGQNFTLELPYEAEILAGDNISIPKTEPILLATVSGIKKNPSDHFQKIFAKSAVNINQLKWTWIVKTDQ